jgi:hypothetical protein
VRLIKVTDLREKEEELASSRAAQTQYVSQHSATSRLRVIGSHILSGEVAEGVQDQASLMLALALAQEGEARVQAELKTTELYLVLEAAGAAAEGGGGQTPRR